MNMKYRALALLLLLGYLGFCFIGGYLKGSRRGTRAISFPRPSHPKMLVLQFLFFKCALICCLKTFFKNPATLGHKENIWGSRFNFIIRVKLKLSACHV